MQLSFLVDIITLEGIFMDQSKMAAAKEWSVLTLEAMNTGDLSVMEKKKKKKTSADKGVCQIP